MRASWRSLPEKELQHTPSRSHCQALLGNRAVTAIVRTSA